MLEENNINITNDTTDIANYTTDTDEVQSNEVIGSEVISAEITTSSTLEEVAKGASDEKSISKAVTSQTLDNLKIFQIVYSRSQLERVVKLTSRLQELEDKLLDRSEEVTDIYDLMNIIRLIQGSLDRSLEAIKQITKNEEYLQVVIQNANIVNGQLNNYNSINSTRDLSKIHNQESRDKVRSAISSILDILNQEASTIDI